MWMGRALEMDPNNLDVRYHLYQVYQQSGMQQEALTQLRLLNGLYPRGEPRTGDWIKMIK